MTQWDQIYKDYQKGGDAWATLSEAVAPQLKRLLKKQSFKHHRALDIGCGPGKYVLFLEKNGFQVDAIDSSKTAIAMAKKVASKTARIQVADMYRFKYPSNTYDLVISISTLHHGTKAQISATVEKIRASLTESGIALITLPDREHALNWNTFQDHTQIEEGTYAPNSGPEKGLPHSFYTQAEIEKLCSKFSSLSLVQDEIGRWFITAHR